MFMESAVFEKVGVCKLRALGSSQDMDSPPDRRHSHSLSAPAELASSMVKWHHCPDDKPSSSTLGESYFPWGLLLNTESKWNIKRSL